MEDRFYLWLKGQFTDYDSAVQFLKKWAHEDKQMTPFGDFTQREMCTFVSYILEGKTLENVSECYITTKYGADLFWSM